MPIPGKNAFMSAMLADAQGGQPGDQPDAGSAQPQPKMENPQNAGPGDQLYLSKDMFAELGDCKVGDEVLVKCKIDSKGDKFGLTPIAVSEDYSSESDNQVSTEEMP